MAGEWPRLSLREANVALIDCDHRTPPASEVGYPYVAIPQLRNGRIDLSNVRRISREHYIEWTRKAKPTAHDVVLSRRCNPGETAFVPQKLEFALGQNLVLLRADATRVYPPFLRWLVRGPEWWEQIGKFLNVGAVFDSLKCADIPRFELHIPPLEEQRAIAHILGTLDDKIELNRRMNETLEAMARAIFKSWFVDFDPIRAKAEGRQPSGMDATTAALFPDSFQDSPLGKIPKGWGLGKIREFLRLSREAVNPGECPDEVFDHFSIPAFDEGRLPKTEKGAEIKSNKFVVAGGAVLLSRLNPRFPRVWLPSPKSTRRSVCSTEFLVAYPYGSGTTEYLYGLFTSDPFLAEFVTLITGTSSSHQRVKAEFLLEMDSVIPDKHVVNRFSKDARHLLARAAANLEESRTLAAIRDALLPKLISGEVRTKDASEFVETSA
jgi:type I restriction enzyme S subunit